MTTDICPNCGHLRSLHERHNRADLYQNHCWGFIGSVGTHDGCCRCTSEEALSPFGARKLAETLLEAAKGIQEVPR